MLWKQKEKSNKLIDSNEGKWHSREDFLEAMYELCHEGWLRCYLWRKG